MKSEDIPLEAYRVERGHGQSLQLISYCEMSSMPQPQWLVDGVLQSRSAALMFGRSNTFKSFLAIDLGLSVATGLAWHGHAAKQGDVLFVVTEGANGVGRLRIPAWYERKGIPAGLRRVFLYPSEIHLDQAADVIALVDAIRETGRFALVVLDIFGGTMSGSEVEDRTARAWVHGVQQILRETEATVLVVAHTGWQDDSRARMHTHFWGSFDTRLRVERQKHAMTAVLSVERHKEAESSGCWGFRLDRAGDSLLPVRDDAIVGDKAGALSDKLRFALNTLNSAADEHGQISRDDQWPPNTRIVALEDWRAEFYRRFTSSRTDAKRQAFKRARDELVARNLIEIRGNTVGRTADA